MSSIPDPVTELACRTLVHEFAQFVDNGEYERLRELFTADAVYARPADPGTHIRGIDNIIASFTSRPKNRVGFHLLTNVAIRSESEDRASGYCRILLYQSDVSEPEVPGKGRKAAASQLLGTYEDKYVRTPQGWRIAERYGRVLMHT